MKKSLISLLLCMTCVFTLAGCQSSPAEQAGTKKAADTAAAAEEASAEAGAGQEDSSPAAEQAQAGETAESSSASAEAGASVPAWTDMTISFDDLTVTLPMSCSDLSGSWTIEVPEGAEAPAELAPGERREGVRLVREGQEDVYVYIDLLNMGDTAAPPGDCTVYGFSAEITWLEEDDAAPSLTLSDGITWGSRLEDLEAAYGKPAAEHRSGEQKYTSYTYAYNYTEVLLTFTVFDEKGLTAVSMVRTP